LAGSDVFNPIANEILSDVFEGGREAYWILLWKHVVRLF
jgi:hypothetical protein